MYVRIESAIIEANYPWDKSRFILNLYIMRWEKIKTIVFMLYYSRLIIKVGQYIYIYRYLNKKLMYTRHDIISLQCTCNFFVDSLAGRTSYDFLRYTMCRFSVRQFSLYDNRDHDFKPTLFSHSTFY